MQSKICNFLFLLLFVPSIRCQFISHFNAKGLRGNITFEIKEESSGNLLVISSYIESSPLNETKPDAKLPVFLEWNVHSNTLYPHMLTTCSNEDLGSIVSEKLQRDLSNTRLIELNKPNQWNLSLNELLKNNSAKSLSSLIWGRSIRLKVSAATKLYDKTVICGNVIDNRTTKTVKATFDRDIAGEIVMRGSEDDTTVILLNLYHIKSKITSRHDWKILASDILDEHRHGEQCKHLQLLFDPTNVESSDCKKENHSKCKMGDLTSKHGQIQVAGQGKNTRKTFIDLNLPLSGLEGSRALFVIIYETTSVIKTPHAKPGILGCAQIKPVSPRKVEANFNMDGVRGTIRLTQIHFSEPTLISYNLFGLEGNIKHSSIRELPLTLRSGSENSKLCNSLGSVYNPRMVAENQDPERFTADYYPVGNLSGKHGQLSVVDSDYEDHYMGEFLDLSIQLYGIQSVAGRAIVMHKNNGDAWVCSTLNHIDELITLAVATFYYPVVGQISFQQLTDDPHSETGVLIEVYNPNNERRISEHDWKIHLKPAMADFYNWSQRCDSSGEIYDPIQSAAGLTNDQYSRQCQASFVSEPLRCRLGDTNIKSSLKISLPKSSLNRSRLFYNDPFLPLSKSYSIIGRSVVLYDEQAPTQRGNRLACSTIKTVHPVKASVRTWSSGPSIPSAVHGSVEFEQETNLKPTRININLSGFNGNVENYAIHSVWMMDDREFPCSNDSLYDIYDPYDNENSLRLPPSAHYGPLATVDRVKVGDMSKKHGTFEGLQVAKKTFMDANVPLFAPRSIIGRSMVLRAAVNDFRWVCGNVELDYDKSSSRKIVAIASFDEPRSKVSGYVRFVQLEHQDGSFGDTYAQIDLKMQSDGVHELETSVGHNWAIFVNQVGEDAFIAADEVRCLASGFKWNPYLAQDSLETYPNSCSPSEHHGCAMGDLGMRHGPLTLGPNNRRVISDFNLPLVGNYSIMGRSLVIFDNKRPALKLACANIYPDIHLKSNVVIKRMPTFTVARFIEQMRSLIGAAEWLMVPELEATKPVANGECVQMTIHFYGRKAHQMQIELSNLVTLGTVKKGGDKLSTHYRLCRITEMQLTSSGRSLVLDHYLLSVTLLLVLHQIQNPLSSHFSFGLYFLFS